MPSSTNFAVILQLSPFQIEFGMEVRA